MPFGRSELWGIAWGWTPAGDRDASRVKPLLAVDTAVPPLPAGWRALVEFVAHYYQQPIGEVAAMAAPPAMMTQRRAWESFMGC